MSKVKELERELELEKAKELFKEQVRILEEISDPEKLKPRSLKITIDSWFESSIAPKYKVELCLNRYNLEDEPKFLQIMQTIKDAVSKSDCKIFGQRIEEC